MGANALGSEAAMRDVDAVTLGAGGGAYPAAFALARAGRTVVMVDDKGVMSGNCLAEGCVPSKAVREVAELARRGRRATRLGLHGQPTVDFGRLMDHKDRVQQTRYRQHADELARVADHVDLLTGHARIADPHTVEVQSPSGHELIRAAHLIVATGAEPFVPPIPGVELALTSHDLFAYHSPHRTVAARLAVIGAGYIGLEVACMWSALGAEVVVLEATSGLLPGMDRDFVELLAGGMSSNIAIELGATVTAIERGPSGLVVSWRRDDLEHRSEADEVVLAIGRHPVIPDGAREIGLQLNGRAISVAPTMRTSIPHIFAPGDVNGRAMLFHAAVRQSLVAAHNILAGDRDVDRMDFGSVPTTIFTSPEAAYVGLTRASAATAGVTLVEAAYPLSGDSRAQILDETYGEIRLFFDAESLRLRGGWVVGIDAAQLIGEIGLAVAAGISAFELARFADQHPMAAEGISNAARQVTG